ncbi:MAG: ankyrin repeat domain-containing protein [Candidatus Babeliales bacterium]|jgi:ankyrin repeat protein
MNMHQRLLALVAGVCLMAGSLLANGTIANDAYAADWDEVRRKIDEIPAKTPENERLKIVDELNEHDATALMWAAAYGNMEMVKYLIGLNADVNAVDKFGNTPLTRAAESGDVEIMKFLVGHRAELWAYASLALEGAIRSHKPAAVTFLLGEQNVVPTKEHLQLAKKHVAIVDKKEKKNAQEIVKILKKKMGKWL